MNFGGFGNLSEGFCAAMSSSDSESDDPGGPNEGWVLRFPLGLLVELRSDPSKATFFGIGGLIWVDEGLMEEEVVPCWG